MFETLFVITLTKTGVGSLGRARSLGRSTRGSHTSWPEAAAAAAADAQAARRRGASATAAAAAIVSTTGRRLVGHVERT
jgi:hypothetical protein